MNRMREAAASSRRLFRVSRPCCAASFQGADRLIDNRHKFDVASRRRGQTNELTRGGAAEGRSASEAVKRKKRLRDNARDDELTRGGAATGRSASEGRQTQKAGCETTRGTMN
jgi:hypothetical protein